MDAEEHVSVLRGYLKREGRCDGGIACQDALEHIRVSLILDILSQKVLAGNPPTPASVRP